MVTQICHTDQQKTDLFESNLCVSYASYIKTLLKQTMALFHLQIVYHTFRRSTDVEQDDGLLSLMQVTLYYNINYNSQF